MTPPAPRDQQALAEALVGALPLSGHGDHDINVAIAVGVLAQHETALEAKPTWGWVQKYEEAIQSRDRECQRADAAEARCAHLEAERDEEALHCRTYEAELLELQAAHDRLRTALETYGIHLRSCAFGFCRQCQLTEGHGHHADSYNGDTTWHPFEDQPCNCGLAAALARPAEGPR